MSSTTAATTTMTIDGRTADVTNMTAQERESLTQALATMTAQERKSIALALGPPATLTECKCRKCRKTYTSYMRGGSMCDTCVGAELERDFERDYQRHLNGEEPDRP